MITTTIADTDDARLVPYRDLKDKQLAAERGLFVVEGEFLVRRLLASDFAVHSVLMTEARFRGSDWDVPEDVTVYLADKAVISEIVGFAFHRGVLALGQRKPARRLEDLRDSENVTRLVVCPEINDVENLGTVMRTGAGLGYRYFLLGPSCCDPFARRAIRTSMGTVFQLNIVQSQDLEADMNRLKTNHGFQWHASVIDNEAEPLHTVSPPDKVGLLIGSEAHGLDDTWLQLADKPVTIPMALGTDSLNVGVAAGIFMHHYRTPVR